MVHAIEIQFIYLFQTVITIVDKNEGMWMTENQSLQLLKSFNNCEFFNG